MPSAYRVGIVGFGVAGGALACLLARAGHAVTIYERAPHVGPVGTGLLLQPSGQMVLQHLGLLNAVLAPSEPLAELCAFHSNGGTLVQLRYSEIAPGCCAYGVHRGTLFEVLRAAACAQNVRVCLDHTITSWRQHDGEVCALDAAGQEHGPFDFLVAADGSRSPLRQAFAPHLARKEYAYGALWTVGPCTRVRHRLHQIVQGNRILIGLLPIGQERCTLFWGLRCDRMESVREQGFAAWREEVVRLCPLAEEVLANADSFQSIVFTDYRHVLLPQPHNDCVVFLGDAAHAMSPHLGQGANLALMDAECLADSLAAADTPHAAFRLYARRRRAAVRYYAQLSRLLTPFFQSDAGLLGVGRDIALPLMTRIPPVRRQMLRTVAGIQQGWFGGSMEIDGLLRELQGGLSHGAS